MTLLRSREPEPVALDSLDEVSSGEMQDFDRASGNVSDLWDQVTLHLQAQTAHCSENPIYVHIPRKGIARP